MKTLSYTLAILAITVIISYCYAIGIFAILSPKSGYVQNPTQTEITFKETLKVLTYNIAFGSGPIEHLQKLRTKQEILTYLDGISSLIISEDPDIVFLQEVDFASNRTHYINQLKYILQKTNYLYGAYVVTWDKGYVPYPTYSFKNHFGKMKSGQAILAKYPIENNKRIALPQPSSNSFIYNHFYLTRCIQIATLDFASTKLVLFNIHLEAFDKSNRIIQAKILLDYLKKYSNLPIIMAGDFNTTPQYARETKNFPDAPEDDYSEDATLDIINNSGLLKEIIPRAVYEKNELKYFTFSSIRPSRRLDYIFYSNGFEKIKETIHQNTLYSDHVPVSALFEIKK